MIRPLTKQLVEAMWMDVWPGFAAQVDFGLDGWGATGDRQQERQRRYEALYYPIREGEITEEQLDAALGSGPKLTELVNKCRHNPHKGIVFQTPYDAMKEEEEDE